MNNESHVHYASKDRSGYVPNRNFGTALSPALRTDPVASSIYRDVDSFFTEGSLAWRQGPASEEAQLYMAEKCSKEWDAACEFASRNNDISKPNVGLVQSPVFQQNAPGTMSIGDYLVLNSATRKYCNMDSCSITESLFNVNDPTSPIVKKIGSMTTRPCMPVCVPPENPDNDILLNKVLNEPQKYTDLLLNMYVNCKNNRNAYNDTRIGKIFQLCDYYFSRK